MAVDLRTATLPWNYSGTAGATWLEIVLPPACGLYTWDNEHATNTLYHANSRNGLPNAPEIPTDGGNVGTQRARVPAGGIIQYVRLGVGDPLVSTSIFVAASGADTPFTLVLEART